MEMWRPVESPSVASCRRSGTWDRQAWSATHGVAAGSGRQQMNCRGQTMDGLLEVARLGKHGQVVVQGLLDTKQMLLILLQLGDLGDLFGDLPSKLAERFLLFPLTLTHHRGQGSHSFKEAGALLHDLLLHGNQSLAMCGQGCVEG